MLQLSGQSLVCGGVSVGTTEASVSRKHRSVVVAVVDVVENTVAVKIGRMFSLFGNLRLYMLPYAPIYYVCYII